MENLFSDTILIDERKPRSLYHLGTATQSGGEDSIEMARFKKKLPFRL